jgi:hypothetical protein
MALAASDTEGLVVFKTEPQKVCNNKKARDLPRVPQGGHFYSGQGLTGVDQS